MSLRKYHQMASTNQMGSHKGILWEGRKNEMYGVSELVCAFTRCIYKISVWASKKKKKKENGEGVFFLPLSVLLRHQAKG